MGEQNYYALATLVAADFRRIGYELNQVLKCLGKRLKKEGEITNKVLKERYGKCKQVRYISKKPLLPITYVRHQVPMGKKRTINAYTPEGRAEIHKNLGIDTRILHLLMRTKVAKRSIEYMDNRLSLYCAQYGKCSITGRILEYDEIHCHHKVPRKLGGGDEYANLTIIHTDAHMLIHAVNPDTVAKYLQSLNPDSKSLKKLNKLRVKAGNEPIAA